MAFVVGGRGGEGKAFLMKFKKGFWREREKGSTFLDDAKEKKKKRGNAFTGHAGKEKKTSKRKKKGSVQDPSIWGREDPTK